MTLLIFMLVPMGVWISTFAQAQPLKWQDSRFAVDECGIRYNVESGRGKKRKTISNQRFRAFGIHSP